MRGARCTDAGSSIWASAFAWAAWALAEAPSPQDFANCQCANLLPLLLYAHTHNAWWLSNTFAKWSCWLFLFYCYSFSLSLSHSVSISISLSLSLYFFLSLSIYIYLSFSLSFCVSLSLYIYISLSLSLSRALSLSLTTFLMMPDEERFLGDCPEIYDGHSKPSPRPPCCWCSFPIPLFDSSCWSCLTWKCGWYHTCAELDYNKGQQQHDDDNADDEDDDDDYDDDDDDDDDDVVDL